MTKSNGFRRAYLIFLCSCILLSTVFLIYVYFVIREFDAAQPERIVEDKMAWLSDKSADGSIARELDFDSLCNNRYENNNAVDFGNAYKNKIYGSELTYEFIAAESGDMFKAYSILADGSPVGTLSLSGENSRTKLFFFSMADWSEQSFSPIPSDTVYNLLVYQPEGTEVFINGISPSEDELTASDNVPAYAVYGLLNEPVIEYKNSDGTPISYITENNTVKPAVYNYQLRIPSNIKVSLNGNQLHGEPAANNMLNYSVREMTMPRIVLSDGFCNQSDYIGGDVEYFSHTVVIPESCTLTVDGVIADDICPPISTPHPDSEMVMEHANVELPSLKTYKLALLSDYAEATVYNQQGDEKTYILLDDSTLEITSFGGSDTIPEEISSQIDIMETAKDWSRFMTDDLDGEQHGLATVQKFLVYDSDYYHYAAEWATGGDIKFTSPHTLDSFTNEKMSDFVRYSENCFSCKVYFEKNMSLIYEDRFAGSRTDVFHSIMYFVYVDDTPDNGTDDPHWALAVMHDVL